MEPLREPALDTDWHDAAPARGGYRVFVRVRPRTQAEAHEPLAVFATSRTRLRVQRVYEKPLELTFDRVFDSEAEQAEVFPAVRDIAAAVVNGRSSTILAYGQTGSGKTHTMTGPGCDEDESAMWPSLLGEHRGIIPRTLEELFCLTSQQCPADGSAFHWQFHVAFMEIYNERVYDLLAGPDSSRCNRRQSVSADRLSFSRATTELGSLDIWEGKDGVVSIPGMTTVEVESLNQVLEVLRLGTACRTCGDNGVNSTSSRSHAIFQISVDKLGEDGGAPLQATKLNLVDLAGSEKLQPAHAGMVSGLVRQELTAINLSLSTLGKCIAALVGAKRSHVPCRDSKLTRLLQDSFRGQSLTAMCICIAPTMSSIEETMSSLKFADRAKRAVLERRSEPQPTGKSQAVSQLLAQVNELKAELGKERGERMRLEGYLKQQVFQDTVPSGSRKAKLNRENKGKAIRVELASSEVSPGDDDVESLGDRSSRNTPVAADLSSTPLQNTWGSDDEREKAFGQCYGSNKVALAADSCKRDEKCFIAASVNSISNSASSPRKSDNVHGHNTTLDNCEGVYEKSDVLARDSSWAPTKELTGLLSDKQEVGNHIAKLDSRLEMLTGMLSEQGEELKRRLDTLQGLSSSPPAKTFLHAPSADVHDCGNLDLMPEPLDDSRPEDRKGSLVPIRHPLKRSLAENSNDSHVKCGQPVVEPRTPCSTASQAESQRKGLAQCPTSSRRQPVRASSLDASSRQAAHSSRTPQSSHQIRPPWGYQNTVKTPLKVRSQDASPRRSSPRPRSKSPATSSCRGGNAKADPRPQFGDSTELTGRRAARTPLRGNQRRASESSAQQDTRRHSRRSSSRSSVATSAAVARKSTESSLPMHVSGNNDDRYASQLQFVDVAAEAEGSECEGRCDVADEIDQKGAAAPVLGTLFGENGTGIAQDNITSMIDEELAPDACKRACMRSALDSFGRSSVEECLGGSKRLRGETKQCMLRVGPGSRGAVGERLRVPDKVAWRTDEFSRAGDVYVRSNSSTSVGSASISGRQLPHAGSDAGSSAVCSASSAVGPASDSGGGGGVARGKRVGLDENVGTCTTPRSNERRTSAMEIAALCWQEFEGALRA